MYVAFGQRANYQIYILNLTRSKDDRAHLNSKFRIYMKLEKENS